MTTSPQGVQRMWELVGRLGPQLRESSRLASECALDLPRDLRRIVVFGMGGSAAAAELMRGCFSGGAREIRVVRAYQPPFDLVEGDLALFSSYSGNTEEVLECYDRVAEADFAGPRVVFSSGGRLSAFAERDGLPRLSIPGGLPPRASLGHGVGLFAGLLGRLGWIDAEAEVESALEVLQRGEVEFGLGGDPAAATPTRALAERFAHRWPVFYSGTPLSTAIARRWRAQWNENAKMLVGAAELPELDHNEIVGWEVPTPARDAACVIAFRDPDEHPQLARRFSITREVLGERVSLWHEVRTDEERRLARAMRLVQLGDVLSVLLADLHGVDPVPVRAIDELKRLLAEPGPES